MRGELATIFNMNASTSKVKRAKRLALEKLEGSFLKHMGKNFELLLREVMVLSIYQKKLFNKEKENS